MVPQHNKVRTVLNVSSPIGSSIKDNVDENGPEKLKMSSAKKFGQSLLDAGEGAKMTKFDIQNAYNIVLCNMKVRSASTRCQMGRKIFYRNN